MTGFSPTGLAVSYCRCLKFLLNRHYRGIKVPPSSIALGLSSLKYCWIWRKSFNFKFFAQSTRRISVSKCLTPSIYYVKTVILETLTSLPCKHGVRLCCFALIIWNLRNDSVRLLSVKTKLIETLTVGNFWNGFKFAGWIHQSSFRLEYKVS